MFAKSDTGTKLPYHSYQMALCPSVNATHVSMVPCSALQRHFTAFSIASSNLQFILKRKLFNVFHFQMEDIAVNNISSKRTLIIEP